MQLPNQVTEIQCRTLFDPVAGRRTTEMAVMAPPVSTVSKCKKSYGVADCEFITAL